MQTQFDLGAAVTVPRVDADGNETRLPGVVVGIAVTAMVGERYRVEFTDEAGNPQSLEYDVAQLAAA